MDNADPAAQAQYDRRRFWRALNAALAGVLVLLACFAIQQTLDWRLLAVTPKSGSGLVGILTSPLLHGSLKHLMANASALIILGTLAGSVYPRTTPRALPLLWIGGGIGAWLLGTPGSHHLGASGFTHGLMFLILGLGLLRRDRAAIATGLIGILFFGSMLITVLPVEQGVSWQSHLGGAVAGLLAAVLLRHADPLLQRKRYSWEDEADLPPDPTPDLSLEARAPDTVPVLWHRQDVTEEQGKIIPFRRPDISSRD